MIPVHTYTSSRYTKLSNNNNAHLAGQSYCDLLKKLSAPVSVTGRVSRMSDRKYSPGFLSTWIFIVCNRGTQAIGIKAAIANSGRPCGVKP